MAPVSLFEANMTESSPAPILLIVFVFNLAMAYICSITADSEEKLSLNGAKFTHISERNLHKMTMAEKEELLHSAAQEGNLTAVQELLNAGTYHSASDIEGYTPLHWAATKGHLEVVRILLDAGAILEARGGKKFQFTPLHLASGEGHLEVSRLLLDRGAYVAAIDKYKDTALHWAAWFGHLPVVQLLVERGADVNAKNADGHTALDMATLKRQHNIVDWLQTQTHIMQ